ncbi:phosphatidylserine/phosphatidylglycerophosphate/cardiolipin synthase-like enzyme [Chryseobacterium sediminis]|uniref:phospholipase D n=1 Tax=Chryseobacterium sediminis TaxID=1679494 RepID=A0ABR6PYR7_9FLAO|nr:phospholipase D-like domain-containing protein [Chryseobacterium sediminis]MBB6330854.1 phosphatidylserine/phosphatidylglycerophosphate/cardiolipin synthase-like enzyme [Chryseobacterium sediminis]
MKTIKAICNSDDVEIIWKYPKIDNCLGFAIQREKEVNGASQLSWVKSSVGFEDEPHLDFEMKNTDLWPIQKYMWTDYLVDSGDTVRYRVIPMVIVENNLVQNENNISDWSNWVTLQTKPTDAFFNRGLVSSQFVSRKLKNLPEKERKKTLDQHLNDEKSPLRKFMGGELLSAIYRFLDEPLGEGNEEVYLFAALYELNDPILIKKLNVIGKRANVILANGAFSDEDLDPQKKNADKLDRINLIRRIVRSPHFAHNKFAILARKNGTNYEPYKVLMGSTNWTHNGLFTQVNNAVVIDDEVVADYYFQEWQKMREDCDQNGMGLYGPAFKTFNETPKTNKTGKIRTWFTPTKKAADMEEAIQLIGNAKDGILFLMFKPGSLKSALLYKKIYERTKEENPPLIHGVINTDPGGKEDPTIQFVDKGKKQTGNFLFATTPENLKDDFGFWKKELPKPSVTIHSKVVLIDPFGDNPILITGSHNMGLKASGSNDDNLNIIRDNPTLCQSYAVHMLAIYHHFRSRFYRSKMGTKWKGLIRDDSWQSWYEKGAYKKELDFWMKGVIQ